MRRPRLADLFCGAGGCSVGYDRAGFEVVGFDLHPQPRYPFEFHQQDALSVDLRGFDAVSASPPCQGYSVLNNAHGADHPLLIDAIRERILETGLPYVIENVEGARAHLDNPVRICGLSVGLNTKRHRLFECSFPVMVPPCGDHRGEWLQVFGEGAARVRARGFRPAASWEDTCAAMGIDWMTRRELSEAIPPAMTEYIGHFLKVEVQRRLLSAERVA